MKKTAPSDEAAKERLRSVLKADRGYLTGEPLEHFRRDIATVVMAYMEVEEGRIRVEFSRAEDGAATLRIEAPGVRARR